MARVLVTGASGFVGRPLAAGLRAAGYTVRAALRRPPAGLVRAQPAMETVVVGDIGPDTDWRTALQGVDAVIHLAGCAHDAKRHAPAALYWRVNVEGTARLAQAAAAAGVGRFVFLSSIKVNGECSAGRPFTALTPPDPRGPYAVSKWEAEKSLWQIARQTGLSATVVRAPLVYGPGVKANFYRLLDLVQRTWLPLPLGGVTNRRSLLYVDNLVSLLLRCLATPRAAGATLLAADGEDLSTPELIRRIGKLLEKRTRLLACPPALLRLPALALGQGALLERLCESLQVDSRESQRLLGWHPPASVDEGLKQTVDWYRHRTNIKIANKDIRCDPVR